MDTPFILSKIGLSGLVLYVFLKILFAVKHKDDHSILESQNKYQPDPIITLLIYSICIIVIFFWEKKQYFKITALPDNNLSKIPQNHKLNSPKDTFPCIEYSSIDQSIENIEKNDLSVINIKPKIETKNESNAKTNIHKESRIFNKKDYSTPLHKSQSRARIPIYAHVFSKQLNFYSITVNGEDENKIIDESGESAVLYLIDGDKVTITFQDKSSETYIFNNGKLYYK